MRLFMPRIAMFVLTSLLFLAFASSLCAGEAYEPVKLLLSCDGKFEHNRQDNYTTLEKNVALSYGDISLSCQYLRVNFLENGITPKSIEARGYLDDADIKEKASGRLRMEWQSVKLSARSVTCSFFPDVVMLEEVSADGDVWIMFERRGYTVHCGHLDLNLDKEGVTTTAKLRPDAAVTRIELGGNGFVATEIEGFITYTKESFVHRGKEIEITYDMAAGKTIVPDNIAKLQADKLTINGGTFDISPFENRFAFGDGVQVRFGEFVLKCNALELDTTKDNRLPKRIIASQGKSPCELALKGMSLHAGSFDFSFDAAGALSSFDARNGVEIVVVDTTNREIRAQSTKAVYAPGLVTLIGDPWVHIQIPAEKAKIREKKCEFILRDGRWEHRGEGIEVEATPGAAKK